MFVQKVLLRYLLKNLFFSGLINTVGHIQLLKNQYEYFGKY